MTLRHKYQTILSQLAPAGVVGVSLALGAAAPAVASEHPAGAQPSATEKEKISERLAAVRDAVSAVGELESVAKPVDGNLQLAWGNRWGNWGWRRSPRWGRGRPWNNWWRNW